MNLEIILNVSIGLLLAYIEWKIIKKAFSFLVLKKLLDNEDFVEGILNGLKKKNNVETFQDKLNKKKEPK